MKLLLKGTKLVHIDELTYILLHQGRRGAYHVGAVHGGRDPVLSKALGGLLGQIDIVLSGVIQDGFGAARVEIFLHILQPADAAARLHRHLRRPADLLQGA